MYLKTKTMFTWKIYSFHAVTATKIVSALYEVEHEFQEINLFHWFS